MHCATWNPSTDRRRDANLWTVDGITQSPTLTSTTRVFTLSLCGCLLLPVRTLDIKPARNLTRTSNLCVQSEWLGDRLPWSWIIIEGTLFSIYHLRQPLCATKMNQMTLSFTWTLSWARQFFLNIEYYLDSWNTFLLWTKISNWVCVRVQDILLYIYYCNFY